MQWTRTYSRLRKSACNAPSKTLTRGSPSVQLSLVLSGRRQHPHSCSAFYSAPAPQGGAGIVAAARAAAATALYQSYLLRA